MYGRATAAAAIVVAVATAPRASGAATAAATAPQPSGAAIAAATAAGMAAMAPTTAAIAGTAMASRRPGSRPASALPGTTAPAAGPMPDTTPTTAPAATTDAISRPASEATASGAGRRPPGWPPRSDARLAAALVAHRRRPVGRGGRSFRADAPARSRACRHADRRSCGRSRDRAPSRPASSSRTARRQLAI